MDGMTPRQSAELRVSSLETEYSSWEGHHKELRDNLAPTRGRFKGEMPNDGRKRQGRLLNNTPLRAGRTSASGMNAGVSSPARPWFRLATVSTGLSELSSVKQWLGDVEQLMREVFNRSNVYQSLPSVYRELLDFATGCMAVVFDYEKIIRTIPLTIGQYYLGQDADGRVNTFARKFKMTVSQVVEMAQKTGGKVSTNVQALYAQKQYDKWIDVWHLIQPNFEHDPSSPWSKDKKFSSLIWEVGSPSESEFIAKEGYDNFIILAPRWEREDGDVYGTDCPGMMALGDSKQLQVQERRKAQAIANMATPPTKAPASTKKLQYSILPGSHSEYEDPQGKGIEPVYQVNPQVQHLLMDIEKTEKRIESSFFADLFLMLTMSDRRDITAREVDERHEEKLLMLGPMLENLHHELLNPLIDLTFAYMERAGIIPPPPPELQGQPLKVVFISVLAQAQNAAGMSAMEHIIQFTGTLAAASQDPSVWDKLDRDQMVDEASAMLGVPPRTVRSDDDVRAGREQRAKQQQQQMQLMAAESASKTAKNLSETDTGSGNMLNAVNDAMRQAQGV